ncbi:MAG: CotH kinase family protein, partial [bacterium]|nr:CotH kinase family protein [bacterium]
FPGLIKHETTELMLRFKRFILRNAGSEWGQSYNTMCRDAMVQTLFGNTHTKIQAYRPALVFLNGEYWGIHNMRELNDERGLENTYGVDPTNVIMMEDNFDGTGQLALGTPLDASNYYSLRGFIRTNDLRIQANYDYIAERMDLESFGDYWLAQIYAYNSSVGHNVSYWRLWTPDYVTLTNVPYGHDGRWRWTVNDMDRAFGGFGGSTDYTYDMLSYVAVSLSRDYLFKKIVSNQTFQVQFINRFADLLNTSLKEQVVTQHVGAVQAALRGDMQEHLSRWGTPTSLATWNANMQVMTTFGLNRARYQRAHITNFFKLPGVATVTLNVSDTSRGSVRINTIEINRATLGVNNPLAPYPWTGIYFRSVPVQLTAQPAFGCRFVGWNSTATTNPVLTVTVTSNATFVAQFELDTNALAQVVPQPHVLANAAYAFTKWDAGAPTGSYPANMIFEQSATLDPGLDVAMDSTWILPYNLTSRSRINGVGSRGVSFINTANAQSLPGAGFLGTALLALNTVSQDTVRVAWTAQTILTNIRVYGVRMQARIGNTGAFASVLGSDAQPVEFTHSTQADWEERFAPVTLPPEFCNQQYVQLRWKYYYIAGDDGARPELRLDDIYVFSAAPFIAPDALVLPRANGEPLPVGLPVNIVWDGAKIFPSLNGTLTRIDQLALYDAASHAAVAVLATNLAASATNCVWTPPASLMETPASYCIGMLVLDNPAGAASRLFTENQFSVVPEPGAGLAVLLLALCRTRRRRHTRSRGGIQHST